MKIIKTLLCLMLTLSMVCATVSYTKSMNGIDDRLNDQSFSYEFSCVVVKDEKLYFCDEKNNKFYSLDWENDVSEQQYSWPDKFSVSKVIFTDNDVVLLDKQAMSAYLDDKYPGTQKFGDTWDPKALYPVDIGIIDDILFILDRDRSNIRRYNFSNYKYIDWVCKQGSHDGELNGPTDFYVYNDKIYVADRLNNRIQIVDKDCNLISYLGRGSGGIKINKPRNIFVNDYIFIIDAPLGVFDQRLVILDSGGNLVETFEQFECSRYDRQGEKKFVDCNFNDVEDMNVLKSGDKYYIFIAAEDYIDMFTFIDERTRPDLIEKISDAQETLDQAEQLARTADNVFNYSFSVSKAKNNLEKASEECNVKNFVECEKYIEVVETWINISYAAEKGLITNLTQLRLNEVEYVINNIEFDDEEQDTVVLLVTKYNEANISYNDGAIVDAMEKIGICNELMASLGQSKVNIDDDQEQDTELYEKLEVFEHTLNISNTKIQKYGLNISLQNIRESLDIAKAYYATGNTELAEDMIETLNQSLQDVLIIISEHETKVNTSKQAVDEYYNNFTKLNKNNDMKEEEDMFEEAYSMLDKEPEKALNISEQAYDSAVKKSNPFCIIPLIILAMSMFVGVIVR